MDEVLKVELDHMVEEQYGSGEAIHMRRNLEETHTKIRGNVRTKLAKYLEPILEVTPADKYQWWFELSLDPRYVNELAYFRKLDEVETFDTRIIINKIMPKFYDYTVAEDLEEKTYTAPPAVTKANSSLYYNEETVWEPITSSMGGNILREKVD